MKQNVGVLTIIVVLLMVAAILTSIWYLMFDKANASSLAKAEGVTEQVPRQAGPTVLVVSEGHAYSSAR